MLQPTADPELANVGALAPVKTVDLLSVPKIKTYLRSLGIDPSGVAIQRGAKNYAGPNCPGASWNCTTATKVVQLAARVSDDDDDDEPENRFVCKPAGTGTHPATNTCMIVQPGPNSNNSATCDSETHQAEGTITQTCLITRTGRRNSAYARQVAGMSASGTDQDVFQTISVRQTSTGFGGNTLETAQSALLRSHGGGHTPVTQDVHQTTCGNQKSSGGRAELRACRPGTDPRRSEGRCGLRRYRSERLSGSRGMHRTGYPVPDHLPWGHKRLCRRCFQPSEGGGKRLHPHPPDLGQREKHDLSAAARLAARRCG